MSEKQPAFSERFVQAAGAASDAARQYRIELDRLLKRRLTTCDRLARIVTLLFALGLAVVCGWLFAQGEDSSVFPIVPPLALLVFAGWYVGYAVLFCFSAVRGRFSERADGAWFRKWNLWCSAALGVILFLWWGYQPDLEHRSFYAIVAVFGFVLLATDAILHGIKGSELASREKLLMIQIAISGEEETATRNRSG